MAASAGTVTLNLDANSVKMIRELQKAQKKTKQTSTRMARDMGRAFGRMSRAATLFGAAMAGAVTTKVVRASIEQQKAVAQLNASLKSTGRYSQEASEGMQAHAAALQQVSTFGDEAIIGAQSLLLTFKGLGGDILPRTTQAVVDMSEKMGMDLKSSAIQLGKALNDPATGLSMLTRVGITFSDEQKNVIKSLQETGDLAGAQAVILEELESQFAGSALAARNTLGGALKAVSNNFGDLLEVSGDDSTGVVGSLNDLADILAQPEVKEGFQNLAQDALELLGALAQLPGTFGFLTDEVKQFFGIIDDNDFVRLDEKLADLKEQREGLTSGFFKKSGDFFKSKLAEIDADIAITQERLDALGMTPVDVTAKRYTGKGDNTAVAPVLPDSESVQAEANKIAETIQTMMTEIEQFGMSESEKALINLMDEGATYEQLALVVRMQEELQKLKDIDDTLEPIEVTAKGGRADEYLENMEAAAEQSAEMMGLVEGAGVNAFNAWIEGSANAKEAFSDMASSMLKQMAAMIVKQAILAAFGAGGGASGGFSLGAAFGGGKASGGPVSGGTAYLVGEKGPEIIVPRNSGTVIPNEKIGSGGVTVNIDARETDDPGRLLALVPVITQQVEAGIGLKQRRGYF